MWNPPHPPHPPLDLQMHVPVCELILIILWFQCFSFDTNRKGTNWLGLSFGCLDFPNVWGRGSPGEVCQIWAKATYPSRILPLLISVTFIFQITQDYTTIFGALPCLTFTPKSCLSGALRSYLWQSSQQPWSHSKNFLHNLSSSRKYKNNGVHLSTDESNTSSLSAHARYRMSVGLTFVSLMDKI